MFYNCVIHHLKWWQPFFKPKKIEMFNFEKKTLMEKEKGRRKFPTTLITIINVRVVGLVAAVMITWKL